MCDGAVWSRRGYLFHVCVVYISVGLKMCAHVYGGLTPIENNLHCFSTVLIEAGSLNQTQSSWI